MSILITKNTTTTFYAILAVNQSDNSIPAALIFIIDIFYPSGELISLQSLRCSLLAVVHYSFVGHFLAFTATLARE
jgi:hypothetical protein